MKENDKKTVMDISKPGTVKPPLNSKNIIVKSMPIIKDPMVLDDQENEDQQLSGPPPLRMGLNRKLNIEPIHNNLVDQDEKEEIKNEDVQLDKIDDQEKENKITEEDTPKIIKATEMTQKGQNLSLLQQPSLENNKNETTNEEKAVGLIQREQVNEDSGVKQQPSLENNKNETTNEEKAVGLIQREQVNEDSSTKQQQLEEDKKKKHDQEINNLILSKKYFLPFNKTQRRKNRRILIATGIILGIILILVWLDLALDTGLIHINGIHPITHFFS
ncbi:MAG: hypothetical protein M1554_03160 [Patescibacteria group bacterium]|jgi:hypothetical protein|nr:hypothetical protein [Patescibacteria group bacterium]